MRRSRKRKRKRESASEEFAAAFGPATFGTGGLWSKTLCKIGIHKWDGFPKGLRLCTKCEHWDGE